MNTDTGRIYEGEEIRKAQQRGEPIVPVSKKVASMMELAQLELEKEARRVVWRKRWYGKS